MRILTERFSMIKVGKFIIVKKPIFLMCVPLSFFKVTCAKRLFTKQQHSGNICNDVTLEIIEKNSKNDDDV
jgi:hypothetical protein